LGKPLLVTGASGKLGTVLRQCWAEGGPQGLVPLWQGRGAVAQGWVGWDILTQRYAGPDLSGGVVLHLAGGTAGAAVDDHAPHALQVLETAAQAGVRHVFLASTAAVYGRAGAAAVPETIPCAPVGAYGRAKAMMEERALDWVQRHPGGPGLTLLRIGNVLGSDSLIGGAKGRRVTELDPVPGAPMGPARSYIGPVSLADVLARLCALAVEGAVLPQVLNVAARPAVAMGDLLTAAGFDWEFGPANSQVIARVELCVDRLLQLVPMPGDAGSPARMLAEWRSLERAGQ
jgi:nucleoside-diphosphate-sugar epimerase